MMLYPPLVHAAGYGDLKTGFFMLDASIDGAALAFGAAWLVIG